MIGDKRLDMPITDSQEKAILEYFNMFIGEDNAANYINARRLAEINNEIYEKQQDEAQKIHDVCYYNRNEDGAWTYDCRKDKSKCPMTCKNCLNERKG
jgi:hypothetical protein